MPTKKLPLANVPMPSETDHARPSNITVGVRRLGDLVREVTEHVLILTPDFQRRLVWPNSVKEKFLDTVLRGLPFPEVFVATGAIDTTSMKRSNLLVDGQQRISTLCQYVKDSPDLELQFVKPYATLNESEKRRFLDYEISVRDLGSRTQVEIRDIFSRINSTNYNLKAIERLNAQFSGQFKNFCDQLSRHEFFEAHRTFTMTDLRRMRDLDFCIILTATLMSTYYHRDTLNLEYMQRFDSSFPEAESIREQIERVFSFIDECQFPKTCRVWKKTDLFTLIIELGTYLSEHTLDSTKVRDALELFYNRVDELFSLQLPEEEAASQSETEVLLRYLKAATKATNDKYARVERAAVIDAVLESTIDPKATPTRKKTTKKIAQKGRKQTQTKGV